MRLPRGSRAGRRERRHGPTCLFRSRHISGTMTITTVAILSFCEQFHSATTTISVAPACSRSCQAIYPFTPRQITGRAWRNPTATTTRQHFDNARVQDSGGSAAVTSATDLSSLDTLMDSPYLERWHHATSVSLFGRLQAHSYCALTLAKVSASVMSHRHAQDKTVLVRRLYKPQSSERVTRSSGRILTGLSGVQTFKGI